MTTMTIITMSKKKSSTKLHKNGNMTIITMSKQKAVNVAQIWQYDNNDNNNNK